MTFVWILLSSVLGNEHTHRYQKNEDVTVWYNTVGPQHNIQETYSFKNLNLCVGDKKVAHTHDSLGEQLLGHEYVPSGMDIRFGMNQSSQYLCSVELDTKDVLMLQYYILQSYWIQTVVDDLPAWTFLGQVNKTNQQSRYFIFTHKHFTISFNEDRIVGVKLDNAEPVEVTEPKLVGKPIVLDFSYSVNWIPTTDSYYTRFESYLDSGFFEHKIHYFSILNSFLIVLFLSALIIFILMRTVKQDFQRYEFQDRMMEFERDLNDDYGWKLVNGDVFRRPTRLSVLSALVGTGIQFLVLSIVVMFLTMTGNLYEEPATIMSTIIFFYTVSAYVNGYYSGKQFSTYGGKNWIQTAALSCSLWPAVVGMVGCVINTVAISYNSSKAVPFLSMLSIFAIWLLCVVPLTLFGFIIGRNWNQGGNFPVRVNPIPRQIPYRPWYLSNRMFMLAGGLVPFGCIAVELYFVLDSIWTYKIYYVYGFLLTICLILVFVTASVAVVITCIPNLCRYNAKF
jgi:transmembrane 9 superfamily protein 3